MTTSILNSQYQSYLSFQQRLKENDFPYDQPLLTKEEFIKKEKAKMERLLKEEAAHQRRIRSLERR